MKESKFGVKYPDEEGNPLTYTTRHGLMKAHLSYKTQLPGIPNISLPYSEFDQMALYSMYFRSKEEHEHFRIQNAHYVSVIKDTILEMNKIMMDKTRSEEPQS